MGKASALRKAAGLAAGLALFWAQASGAAPSAPALAATQQILETERAFAQTVAQTGIAPGFRQFAAPDAVMFDPDPMPAGALLEKAHWPGDLLWRPQFVGAAGSGDLGFSAGPSVLRIGGKASGGYYLTIWKRVDGTFKFLLDHGVDMPAALFAAAPQVPAMVDATPTGSAALEGMREADGAFNIALPKDAGTAYENRLDTQGFVVRANRAVGAGKHNALALVQESPPILEAFTLGGGLSADGGFGYAWGRARWSAAIGAQNGYYVRVWRSTPQGWRLLADQLGER